jgi:hypothetical protein
MPASSLAGLPAAACRLHVRYMTHYMPPARALHDALHRTARPHICWHVMTSSCLLVPLQDGSQGALHKLLSAMLAGDMAAYKAAAAPALLEQVGLQRG